jgi:hypothetical protein
VLATILGSTVPFDGTDPFVALLAWALTILARRYAPAKIKARVHQLTPAVAVLLAVFLRAGLSVAYDEPMTAQVALRALAAGAVAVWGHSQLREVIKGITPEETPPADPPKP